MEGVNGHFSWWKSRRAKSATKISNFKFSFPNNIMVKSIWTDQLNYVLVKNGIQQSNERNKFYCLYLFAQISSLFFAIYKLYVTFLFLDIVSS